MGERTFAALLVLAVVTGGMFIASFMMLSFVNVDFSTGATFVVKMLALILLFAVLVYFHYKSLSDSWSSYSSDLYWYAYPVIISLAFMSWWPVIRFTNFPDFVDVSRFLTWYQSYPFLFACLVALLLGLQLLMRKTVQDWID